MTKDSLQVFKKSTSRISEAGDFLYTVHISSLDLVNLEDRRGYLTLVLQSRTKEPSRLLMRRAEGIQEWHSTLQKLHSECTSRGRSTLTMLSTEDFWNKRQFSDLGCSRQLGKELSMTEKATGDGYLDLIGL